MLVAQEEMVVMDLLTHDEMEQGKHEQVAVEERPMVLIVVLVVLVVEETVEILTVLLEKMVLLIQVVVLEVLMHKEL